VIDPVDRSSLWALGIRHWISSSMEASDIALFLGETVTKTVLSQSLYGFVTRVVTARM
jgi:hypothetical protein